MNGQTANSSDAWVKLAILADGVVPHPSFGSWFAKARGYARRRNFYNTPVWGAGSSVSLPQEIRLGEVVVAVNSYGSSPWVLIREDGDQHEEAYVINETLGETHRIEAIRDLVSLHEDAELARVCNLYGGSALSFFSPRACYFFADHVECRFCSLAGTAAATDFANRITPDEIFSAVARVVAAESQRINQVMIVGGNERDLDRGFTNHLALVRAASEALREAAVDDGISVHLVTMPPHDHRLIDQLGDLPNVHAGFNLEVWDTGIFERIAPGKAANYGRPKILAALERLRMAVGDYRAHSILIAGLEPPESTLGGVRRLAEMGVSAIVNAYHSDRHSRLGLTVRPSFGELAAVAQGLQELYDIYPLQPYWKGCGRNAMDFEASKGMFRGSIPDLA